MQSSRRAIAKQAAEKLDALPASRLRALVGFDGFVDAIVDVVDQRGSMQASEYRAIDTIRAFAERIAAAAEKSTNMEVVVKEKRFGGNGPLMAGGLAALGAKTSFIGCIGQATDWRQVDPVFAPFAQRCVQSGGEVLSAAQPAMTDALEFSDGKIMFNNSGALYGVTWKMIVERIGPDRLQAMVGQSALLAIVNWTNMGCVGEIYAGLARLLAQSAHRPRVFVDLSDPAKRTDTELRTMLAQVAVLNEVGPVTLGLNLAEAQRLDSVCGTMILSGRQRPTGSELVSCAVELRRATGLDTVVIHPREGAAAADRRTEPAWLDGPMVARPRLSTGAGDHFNAGFALAQSCGLGLAESLATGCATSGAYVRDAQSPTLTRLVGMLRDFPDPE